MEILLTNLIHHKYKAEYLIKNGEINTLKDDKLEWNEDENKKNPFQKDILNADLCFSIEDVDTHEIYGYYFITKRTLSENTAYYLDKVIFDNELTDSCVEYFTPIMLGLLVNQDYLEKDRFIAKSNLPFSKIYIKDTTQKVIKEIKDAVHIKKDKIVEIPDDLMAKIKKGFHLT